MRRGTAARRFLVLALAVLLPGAARAGEGAAAPPAGEKKPEEKPKDTRPVSSDDAAKAAIERFDRDFQSKDEGRRMNAIVYLAQTKNDLVTKKLGTLLAHPSLDVRQGAAVSLADQYQNPELAGEILRKALLAENEGEVAMNIALALGRILYVKAIPDMGEVMKKADDVFLKMEILKAFGKMKDKNALLPILDLWLVDPHGFSWQGGEEKYDSGASGDSDQKEAERRYKEKHKNDRRRAAPPVMLKTYIQCIVETLFQITGQKFHDPGEYMRWLCEHEAEMPFPLPGKVKAALKEWDEKKAKKTK